MVVFVGRMEPAVQGVCFGSQKCLKYTGHFTGKLILVEGGYLTL